MSRTLGVTWFEHRRMTELCAGLNIELVVCKTRLRGPLRYLLLGIRTLAMYLRRRPEVLLVQNPSLILAALSLLLRPLLGYRVVVDAHNEAVQPYKNQQRWVSRLSRWVIRAADLTVVTNRFLAEHVVLQGGTPFTLPDRVPSPPAVPARILPGKFSVVLVATFDVDEPYAEVFAAIAGTETDLYVTGNYRKLRSDVAAAIPANVHFTGFLEDRSYWSLLRGAHAIVDLTLKDNCLVCGSYEALALAKPMLLSDNLAGRELFGGSAIFTDNTSADIRRALAQLRADSAVLERAAQHKRAELIEAWNNSARSFVLAMSPLRAKAGAADKRLVN